MNIPVTTQQISQIDIPSKIVQNVLCCLYGLFILRVQLQAAIIIAYMIDGNVHLSESICVWIDVGEIYGIKISHVRHETHEDFVHIAVLILSVLTFFYVLKYLDSGLRGVLDGDKIGPLFILDYFEVFFYIGLIILYHSVYIFKHIILVGRRDLDTNPLHFRFLLFYINLRKRVPVK